MATRCRHGCDFCYVPTTAPHRYHTGNVEFTKQAAIDAGEPELYRTLVEIYVRGHHLIEPELDRLRLVQKIGAELALPIYLLPDDHIIHIVEGPERGWLQFWKKRGSPGPFAVRDPPEDPLPALPSARASAADLRRCSG